MPESSIKDGSRQIGQPTTDRIKETYLICFSRITGCAFSSICLPEAGADRIEGAGRGAERAVCRAEQSRNRLYPAEFKIYVAEQ